MLPEFQKQGFGRTLIRAAEQAIVQKLGPAQRLYIQEGYVPNTEGVTVNHQVLNYGHTGSVDDAWVLWMTKQSN